MEHAGKKQRHKRLTESVQHKCNCNPRSRKLSNEARAIFEYIIRRNFQLIKNIKLVSKHTANYKQDKYIQLYSNEKHTM